MRWFPLSLFIYPKLCSFGLLLKMRCIFFTEQSYTDQGAPLDPQSLAVLLSPIKPAICVPNSAQAEFGGFGLGLLVSRGFFGAKA